jgi:hypothetical protein
MGWYDSVKRYVWDEEKTPHLIPVAGLSQSQAKGELFVYTLFLAILFALAALIFLTGAKSGANFTSLGMAFYAFSVFCSAVILGMNKAYSAAVYAASAPLAGFLYTIADGFGPGLEWVEKIGLLIFTLLWFRYAFRIMAITKAFPELPAEIKQL